MNKTKIAAIIIAGGYSSRMGSFKPFLQFGEKTALEMLIETYKSAGINKIIVVAGYRGSEVAEKLRESGTVCVQNANYAAGMFTSVIEGVKALDADITAFFMHPVDIPLVKRYTLETLKNMYQASGKGIIHPNFGGRRGHPPLIDCKYRDTILRSNGGGGLKRILEELYFDAIDVAVFDKTILMDMDTQEGYEKLLDYFQTVAPDRDECGCILDIYHVPLNIVRHGRRVAEVSAVILRSLKPAGYELDKCALIAAAMLHDMARQEKNHARVGEGILQAMGYGGVGSIIGSHHDIVVDDKGRITENEILYLADKLVKEDNVISIHQRFNSSLDKYKDNPEALMKIETRMDAAYKIIRKIEAATGRDFIYGH